MQVKDFSDEHQWVLFVLGFKPEKKVFMLNGYPAVSTRDGVRYVHRLVAAEIIGIALNRKIFVHHVDENRANFLPANLHTCTLGEHNTHHRRFGVANHFFGKKHSAATKRNISQKRVGKPGHPTSDSTKLILSIKAAARHVKHA